LHFERADVEPAVYYAIETGTALVEERRWGKARIASIDSRASRQWAVRQCWTAIVLQWAEQGIGINLITRTIQKTDSVVAAEIVAE
jgi:hypothetical protein